MDLSDSAAAADWDPAGAQEYAALLSAVFGESDTDEDPEDELSTEEVSNVFLFQTQLRAQ
jgi:hypothetical protein